MVAADHYSAKCGFSPWKKPVAAETLMPPQDAASTALVVLSTEGASANNFRISKNSKIG